MAYIQFTTPWGVVNLEKVVKAVYKVGIT